MAEPSPDRSLMKIVGALISAAVGGALGSLPGSLSSIGPGLTTLLVAGGGIAGLVFSLMFKRYVGVLGAGGRTKGSPARDAYDRLRKTLSGGNMASRLYSEWLTKFLDAIDRFFGDAGMADRTLFPRAFRLKTPAPLWTARPLSAAGILLPDSDDFRHLGDIWPCRARGGSIESQAP